MAEGGRTETHANIELVGVSLLRGVSAPQSLLFFGLRFFVRSTMFTPCPDRRPYHFDASTQHVVRNTKYPVVRTSYETLGTDYAVLRTHHIGRSQQAATRRCLPQCRACRAVRSASKAADAAPLVSCAETEADEGSSKVDSRMIHGVHSSSAR